MSLAEARALFQKGRQQFHVEPYDPFEDRRMLEELAAECHRFAPTAGLEESEFPETLLLDITGVAELFGGELRLCQQITAVFEEQGWIACLGVGATVGAAWARAHYSRGPAALVASGRENLREADPRDASWERASQSGLPVAKSRRRSAERIAQKAAEEHGTSEEIPEPMAIERLPLQALRLPSATVEALRRLGLERIGDLLRLPRADLQSRFGQQLLTRLDQAIGDQAELIKPVKSPPELMVQQMFEYPVTDRNIIEPVIHQLIEQLCVELTQHVAGALHLQCRLDCQKASPIVLEVGCFRPSVDPEHLQTLFEVPLERMRLKAPVLEISLQVARSARLHPRQKELFEREQSQDSPHVASLVDRLASRLGRKAVVRSVLQNNPQPENAYTYEPLIGRSTARRRAGSRSPFSWLDRPLRVLQEPIALASCELANKKILRFQYQGKQHRVSRYWGPERIETGWWQHRGIRRDYYRVETVAGSRFWLFQDRKSNRWFMHGIFI